MLDPLSLAEVHEGQDIARMDALVVEAGMLKPKMLQLQRVMSQAGATSGLAVLDFQLSEPVRRFGGVHIAAIFELNDGQTVTVWLHNPDSTPARLTPADTLVSWKWMLNKKDITGVVAPENGRDLPSRDVARRVMSLAAKNSAAFGKANQRRAAKMVAIETLKGGLAEKLALLKALHEKIVFLKSALTDKETRAMVPSSVVAVTGKELGEFPDDRDGFKARRAAMLERAKETWRGESVYNAALRADVELRISGLRHMLNVGLTPDTLSLLPALPQLVARAQLLRSEAPRPTDDRNLKRSCVMSVPAFIGERKVRARLRINQDNMGHYTYDMALSAVEAEALLMDDAAVYLGVRSVLNLVIEADTGVGLDFGDEGPAPAPEADPIAADLATLRAVAAGEFDALGSRDLLAKVTAATRVLEAAGRLADPETDALASSAIEHWATLQHATL
jgi:hypothetical protein